MEGSSALRKGTRGSATLVADWIIPDTKKPLSEESGFFTDGRGLNFEEVHDPFSCFTTFVNRGNN